MRPKVCLGIPSYGQVPADWWVPLSQFCAAQEKYGIEVIDIIHRGGMMVDQNRNFIVRQFLDKTNADWLYWVDSDNLNPLAAIKTLVDGAGDEKTLMCGVYYLKSTPTKPVAYEMSEGGRYYSMKNWRPGEILAIDGAGMNGVLCHRSVFEDIEKHYVPLQMASGGIVAVHKDDIDGEVFHNTTDEKDWKVIDGVLHMRLYPPSSMKTELPFFSIAYSRTEDFDFFEKAARVGHKLWCDTRVEAGHLRYTQVTGADYRKERREDPGDETI